MTESKFRISLGTARIGADDPINPALGSGRGFSYFSHAHDFRLTRWQRFKRWFARVILRRGPKPHCWDGENMVSPNGRDTHKYYSDGGPINRTKYWKPRDVRITDDADWLNHGELYT